MKIKSHRRMTGFSRPHQWRDMVKETTQGNLIIGRTLQLAMDRLHTFLTGFKWHFGKVYCGSEGTTYDQKMQIYLKLHGDTHSTCLWLAQAFVGGFVGLPWVISSDAVM